MPRKPAQRRGQEVETLASLRRIQGGNSVGFDDVVTAVDEVSGALTLTCRFVELDTVKATVEAWIAAHPSARVKAVTQVSAKTWIFYEE